MEYRYMYCSTVRSCPETVKNGAQHNFETKQKKGQKFRHRETKQRLIDQLRLKSFVYVSPIHIKYTHTEDR
jgi:hypothetical protein